MRFNMKNISGLLNGAKAYATEHRTQILTGIGVAGMFTMTGMAVSETPRALVMIEERKREINRQLMEEALDNGDEDCTQVNRLTVPETVRTCWKVYAPSAIIGMFSAACIFSACARSCRANAALGAALQLSENAFRDYKDATKEVAGPDLEGTIVERVAEKKLEATPMNRNQVFNTGAGSTLCLDAVSGRYFISSPDVIRRAESFVNKNLADDIMITLNQFYCELNLPEISIGENLGWEIGKKALDVQLTSQLTANDEPCLVMNYEVAPSYWRY